MDAVVVEAVLEDWQTAPISDRLRAILGFLAKLNNAPDDVIDADIVALEQNGVSQDAIAEAAYVCLMFNIMDRLADAFDFEMSNDRSQGRVGTFLFRMGYGAASLRG